MGNMTRQYIPLDPDLGYPAGDGIYYECVRCGDILHSAPPDPVTCKCHNIRIDVDAGRLAVAEVSEIRVFLSGELPTPQG